MAYLRGGVRWLLSDGKDYVDSHFAQMPGMAWLYEKYPNALSSLFTLHPHPIARAQELKKRLLSLNLKLLLKSSIAS